MGEAEGLGQASCVLMAKETLPAMGQPPAKVLNSSQSSFESGIVTQKEGAYIKWKAWFGERHQGPQSP